MKIFQIILYLFVKNSALELTVSELRIFSSFFNFQKIFKFWPSFWTIFFTFLIFEKNFQILTFFRKNFQIWLSFWTIFHLFIFQKIFKFWLFLNDFSPKMKFLNFLMLLLLTVYSISSRCLDDILCYCVRYMYV